MIYGMKQSVDLLKQAFQTRKLLRSVVTNPCKCCGDTHTCGLRTLYQSWTDSEEGLPN
ncbi:hypothetical protein XHV734_4483 [Xanthomonas hortorum pv. vitians]|nr:hypothetical protein XHV734_4483 [Xanthomonas hortorum pv. vitians]